MLFYGTCVRRRCFCLSLRPQKRRPLPLSTAPAMTATDAPASTGISRPPGNLFRAPWNFPFPSPWSIATLLFRPLSPTPLRRCDTWRGTNTRGQCNWTRREFENKGGKRGKICLPCLPYLSISVAYVGVSTVTRGYEKKGGTEGKCQEEEEGRRKPSETRPP